MIDFALHLDLFEHHPESSILFAIWKAKQLTKSAFEQDTCC